MKKIYLSIIGIGFMLSANAQLSLTKSFNEPVLGDINTKQGFDTVAVLPSNTGTNQVWDFSALTTNTVVDVVTFTTVASTPNGANYSTATLADDDAQGAYNYYKSTATQYEVVGLEDPNLSLNLSNSAIAAIWPVSMGYSNTDVFSGTASTTAGNGTATGTINTIASGTGTLMLPGGLSFTNVLQVKASQRVHVSLAFGLITATVVSTDYNYYHASQKFPLLTVSYNDISGALTSNTGTVKVNNLLITGINKLSSNDLLTVFPNPAKNDINIKLNNKFSENCEVTIYNAFGQVVKSSLLGNSADISSHICIDDLSSGIYTVKTNIGNKVAFRKIIKE
jgi:hypothetical protein